MAITPSEAQGLIGCRIRATVQEPGGERTMPYTAMVTKVVSSLNRHYLQMGPYRLPLQGIVNYIILDDVRWESAGTIKDGEVTMVDMDKKLGLDNVTFDEYEGCDVVVTMKSGREYRGRLERHGGHRELFRLVPGVGGDAITGYRDSVLSIKPARDHQSPEDDDVEGRDYVAFPEDHTLEGQEFKDVEVAAKTGGDNTHITPRESNLLERIETETTDLLVAAGVTPGIASRLVEDMLERCVNSICTGTD